MAMWDVLTNPYLFQVLVIILIIKYLQGSACYYHIVYMCMTLRSRNISNNADHQGCASKDPQKSIPVLYGILEVAYLPVCITGSVDIKIILICTGWARLAGGRTWFFIAKETAIKSMQI